MNYILLNSTYNTYDDVYEGCKFLYKISDTPFNRPYIERFIPTNQVDYYTFLQTITAEIHALQEDFNKIKHKFDY